MIPYHMKCFRYTIIYSWIELGYVFCWQIDVLKENLGKAEDEISELDHIIDQVREVMHQEIGVVKHSPTLLQLIRELDGVEAPNSYWIIMIAPINVLSLCCTRYCQ